MIYKKKDNLYNILFTLKYNIYGGGKNSLSYDERNYHDGIERKKILNEYEYFIIKSGEKAPTKDLDRIKKLKIPPAWTDVWVSIDTSTNIQAIGIDEKGRKQYKYHEKYIVEAAQKKFIKMIDFIKALPGLEKHMKLHEKFNTYDKNRVIVTMLQIVKKLHMRVGKEQYARENKSYGVSSLQKKHVYIEGHLIKFKFKGKSNKQLAYSLNDAVIFDHIALLCKLQGKENNDKLFQYIDINNKIKKVTDTDLNIYLQEYMGASFTVKDFRTYAANIHFIKSLLSETKKRLPKTPAIIKKNILNSFKVSSKSLKHTKNISKKSYVLDFCIELYQENPDYFIERRNDKPSDVLLSILLLYKNNIINAV